MTSGGKIPLPEWEMKRLEVFEVDSWSLEEYKDCVSNPNFMEQVRSVLDSAITIMTDEDLLLSKYYFAGSCCRYMFHYDTDKLIHLLNTKIEQVSDFNSLLNSRVGGTSAVAVNSLQCRFTANSGQSKFYIVSEFVATQIAIKCGPDYIESVIQSTRASQNPALYGWLLELWFFASITNGGFEYKDENRQLHRWEESAYSLFDPLNVTAQDLHNKWLKPKKWNQGGYDAVHLHDGIVTFVQVTRAKKHTLNYSYFQMLVCNLFHMQYDIKKIEIFFVIPEKQKGTYVHEIDLQVFFDFLKARQKLYTFKKYETIRAMKMKCELL